MRIMGYDMQFTPTYQFERSNPENNGLTRWIATTVKPIYKTQRLIGLGARGKTKATACMRLLFLLAVLGPQPLIEGQSIPVY